MSFKRFLMALEIALLAERSSTYTDKTHQTKVSLAEFIENS